MNEIAPPRISRHRAVTITVAALTMADALGSTWLDAPLIELAS